MPGTEFKNQVDNLMNILFGAGVASHATIIEQINYLVFLRSLSKKDDSAMILDSSAEKIFSGVEYAKSDAGFYLFLKCHDSEKTAEKILEKGIAVTPGTVFGGYENFIRISLTQPLELLTPALKIIEEEIR